MRRWFQEMFLVLSKIQSIVEALEATIEITTKWENFKNSEEHLIIHQSKLRLEV